MIKLLPPPISIRVGVLGIFLILASSCAKETHLLEVANGKNSLESRASSSSSSSCRCFMRVLSVSGIQPAGFWELKDDSYNFAVPSILPTTISGSGQTWNLPQGGFANLPSNFFELSGPPTYASYGSNRIMAISDPNGINPTLEIEAEIKCVTFPGTLTGSNLYITTYSEVFIFGNSPPTIGNVRWFIRDYDCPRTDDNG